MIKKARSSSGSTSTSTNLDGTLYPTSAKPNASELGTPINTRDYVEFNSEEVDSVWA